MNDLVIYFAMTFGKSDLEIYGSASCSCSEDLDELCELWPAERKVFKCLCIHSRDVVNT